MDPLFTCVVTPVLFSAETGGKKPEDGVARRSHAAANAKSKSATALLRFDWFKGGDAQKACLDISSSSKKGYFASMLGKKYTYREYVDNIHNKLTRWAPRWSLWRSSRSSGRSLCVKRSPGPPAWCPPRSRRSRWSTAPSSPVGTTRWEQQVSTGLWPVGPLIKWHVAFRGVYWQEWNWIQSCCFCVVKIRLWGYSLT